MKGYYPVTDLLFFCNLYDAPDASIALVDYERHTFYHHHRSVETQCLWLVDTYLTDKSVESHQQVLLAVAGTLRIIYAMNDDESEIARDSVFAKRRIGALQIYLLACHKIFHHLSQI